jgi:hypothetical protein
LKSDIECSLNDVMQDKIARLAPISHEVKPRATGIAGAEADCRGKQARRSGTEPGLVG